MGKVTTHARKNIGENQLKKKTVNAENVWENFTEHAKSVRLSNDG